MSKVPTVLVVEDDEDDFFLTQRVLRRHPTGAILHLESGRAAIEYFRGEGDYGDRTRFPLPDIVLLDLKLDQGTGHDVLAEIRALPRDTLPRIYVLTGSNEPRDRELVKSSGVAAGYIVKPLSSEHVAKILSEWGQGP